MKATDIISYIPVAIPQELKVMFNRDKSKLDVRNHGGDFEKNELEQFLVKDDVLSVYNYVTHLTSYSSYNTMVEKEGFFKEFPEWFIFAVDKILESQGITLADRENYYGPLTAFAIASDWFKGRDVASIKQALKENERNVIIATVLFVNKKTNRCFDQNQLYNASKLFLNLATKDIKAEDLADISYAAFQSEREKESGMGE